MVEGVEERFDDLIFHGGEGMRTICACSAESDLLRGAERRRILPGRGAHRHRPPDFGILWPIHYAVPIVARA